jgi:hypothetical protein
MTAPTLRTPAEGRTITVVGDVHRSLATGEDTNGRYALWEAVVPPGGGPRRRDVTGRCCSRWRRDRGPKHSDGGFRPLDEEVGEDGTPDSGPGTRDNNSAGRIRTVYHDRRPDPLFRPRRIG